jgi:hypothetical protein
MERRDGKQDENGDRDEQEQPSPWLLGGARAARTWPSLVGGTGILRLTAHDHIS